MTGTGLELRVSSAVETVLQVGRVVAEPRRGTVAGVPTVVPGRESEVAEIVRLVGAGAPVVVVHGAPGSGSTAVGLAAAARLEARFPGGARFVPATPDPAAALGATLGAPEPRLLSAALAARPTLLVLDDVAGAAPVRALRPPPGSAVVAVTAHPLPALELDGAVTVRLAPCPAADSLPTLTPIERAVLAAAARLVRAGAPTVDAASCGALLGADVTAPLRALRTRGLLSPRPGPEGLTCAVPRAVLRRVPTGPTTPRPGHPSPPLPRRESDILDGAPPVDTAPARSGAVASVAAVAPDVLDGVLTRIEDRLRTPAPAPDPVAAALAAVAVSELGGDPDTLARTTLALADALAAESDLARAHRAYEAVLHAPGGDDELRAAALRGRGLLAARQDRPAAALADLRAAVALQQTAGAAAAAATWVAIGEIERAVGHPCPAVSAFRAALATLAEHGDRLADTWTTLARSHVQTGPLAPLPLPDTPAGRAVGALAELDPSAPPPALVVALTAADLLPPPTDPDPPAGPPSSPRSGAPGHPAYRTQS